jgi:hypothetical protein
MEVLAEVVAGREVLVEVLHVLLEMIRVRAPKLTDEDRFVGGWEAQGGGGVQDAAGVRHRTAPRTSASWHVLR